MILQFPKETEEKFVTSAQKVKAQAKEWFLKNAYCPECSGGLDAVADEEEMGLYECEKCKKTYIFRPLKEISDKFLGGSYSFYAKAMDKGTFPSFFLLSYDENLEVTNLLFIPSYYIVKDMIKKRKPLGKDSRKPGWEGTTIVITDVPEAGKIWIIKDKNVIDKKEVSEKIKKTEFFNNYRNTKFKNWTFMVMKALENLEKEEFTVNDLCDLEKSVKRKFPGNTPLKIKASIRQKLQMLRDYGYIEFLGEGIYRKA